MFVGVDVIVGVGDVVTDGVVVIDCEGVFVGVTELVGVCVGVFVWVGVGEIVKYREEYSVYKL